MPIDVFKEWAKGDKLLPTVMDYVGLALRATKVQIASEFLDLQQATDLVAFVGGQRKYVAVRNREFKYLPYGDFTIRYWLGGARTEIHKIIEDCYGDYLAYGIYRANGLGFARWWLIDLAVFRLNYREDLGDVRTNVNDEGRSQLIAFKPKMFPKEMMVCELNDLSEMELE